MVIELLNIAIEAICNTFTLERDDYIKPIKDVASAAVFNMIVFNEILLFVLF